MPSHTMSRCALRNDSTVRASVSANAAGFARRRPRRLHDEPGIDARQAHSRHLGPDVHRHDAGSLHVEVQEPRPSSAHGHADGAFGHPALLDQLADDRGHGAALHARPAGEIGPRHRRIAADDVERDAPVDLARGFAGRDLEVGEVDLAHGESNGQRQLDLLLARTILTGEAGVKVEQARQGSTSEPPRPALSEARRLFRRRTE